MSDNSATDTEDKSTDLNREGRLWLVIVGALFAIAFVAVLVEAIISPGDKPAFVAGLSVMGGALILVSILVAGQADLHNGVA